MMRRLREHGDDEAGDDGNDEEDDDGIILHMGGVEVTFIRWSKIIVEFSN